MTKKQEKPVYYKIDEKSLDDLKEFANFADDSLNGINCAGDLCFDQQERLLEGLGSLAIVRRIIQENIEVAKK